MWVGRERGGWVGGVEGGRERGGRERWGERRERDAREEVGERDVRRGERGASARRCEREVGAEE